MPITQILGLLLSAIDVAERVGFNVYELIDKRNQAKAEGRDLTQEELDSFKQSAQNKIDQL